MPAATEGRHSDSVQVLVACSDTTLRGQIGRTLAAAPDLLSVQLDYVTSDRPRQAGAAGDCVLVIDDTAALRHQLRRTWKVFEREAPPTLLLCERCVPEVVSAALQMGLRGCLEKRAVARDLVRALRAIHAGDIWASRHVLVEAMQELANTHATSSTDQTQLDQLTAREREIIYWVKAGLSNKQIGSRLTISDTTVKAHLRRIFRKLGLHRRFDILIGGRESDD